MVKRRRTIVVEEPSREPVTPGYAPSGESAFTRHAAQGKPVDAHSRDRPTLSRLDAMVIHERKQVAKLEMRTAAERGGEKYPMLCVKLQRLRAFLRRLENDQRELAGKS